MYLNKKAIDSELFDMLAEKQLSVGSSAAAPLKKVDFEQLVSVYDHEEHFLRTKFIELLLDAHKARNFDRSSGSITATDVRTAMLMLGQVVAEAPDHQFSEENKRKLKDSCPYCTE